MLLHILTFSVVPPMRMRIMKEKDPFPNHLHRPVHVLQSTPVGEQFGHPIWSTRGRR